MTLPNAYSGRPTMPAPGAPTPELRIVRFRRHGRRLVWPALVLIAVAALVGYGTGNLPDPFQDWMLWAAGGAVVVLLALVPFLGWLAHSYTITTRRVVMQVGLLRRHRTEIGHARGYRIAERRGPIQRLWGAGTLTLANGVDLPLRMVDIPAVRLVHEVLADQVEVSQILAHRDSQSTPLDVRLPER